MFSSTDTLVVRVRASSCTGRDFAIYSPITLAKYLIVDRGVIFKYDYINKENKPLFNYTVSREDCLKVK
jgi:hypothetical protein